MNEYIVLFTVLARNHTQSGAGCERLSFEKLIDAREPAELRLFNVYRRQNTSSLACCAFDRSRFNVSYQVKPGQRARSRTIHDDLDVSTHLRCLYCLRVLVIHHRFLRPSLPRRPKPEQEGQATSKGNALACSATVCHFCCSIPNVFACLLSMLYGFLFSATSTMFWAYHRLLSEWLHSAPLAPNLSHRSFVQHDE
jgi:hypothetical protein